jgi:PAS domain S-box-containing protein
MDRVDLEQWKPKEVARLLALVETERRYYQEIVANVPVGLLIVASDLSVVSANKYFRKLRGMRNDELQRRKIEEILPLDGLSDKVQQVLTTGKPQGRLPGVFQFGDQQLNCMVSVQYLQGWELDAGSEALLIVENLGAVDAAAVSSLPSVVNTVATVEPAVVEPAVVEPAVVEPVAVEPVAVEPAVEPVAAETAGDLEPASLVSAVVEPATEEPVVVPAPEKIIERVVETVTVTETVTETITSFALVNDIDAVVWEADPATLRYLYVSERAEELFGYDPARWLEESEFWRNHIHADDRERVMEFYRGAANSGTSHVIEYRALTADGSSLWVREIVRVARDSEGTAIKFTGLTLDISSRRQAEEQAIQTHKVEALGRLAAKVAHDFNNLLMIISGYSEEMKNSVPPGSNLHHDMQEIMRATERVQGLTAQLQQYTRKMPQQPKVLDINALLHHMEPMLRRNLGDGIELAVEAQSDGGMVKVDQALLEQALTTLALHAKFEMHGLGRVTVSTTDLDLDEDYGPRYTRPGSYISLSVSDSGPGLEDDQRAKLFEPWLISDETTREERLALSSAYNLIKQAGGDVAVISEAGKGTSFRVTLPRAMEQPTPHVVETPTIQDANKAAAAQDEVALETILVVEDEAGIRALVRKILRRQGYQVLEAPNGPEAIQICAQHKGTIDLLVTDVMMPQMSGRELAERLAAVRKDLKVLFVSGYTDDAMLQSGSFPPGTAFLQKPFTLGSLLGKVREVLDISRGASA